MLADCPTSCQFRLRGADTNGLQPGVPDFSTVHVDGSVSNSRTRLTVARQSNLTLGPYGSKQRFAGPIGVRFGLDPVRFLS